MGVPVDCLSVLPGHRRGPERGEPQEAVMWEWLECRYDEATSEIWIRSQERARTNLRGIILGSSLAGSVAALALLLRSGIERPTWREIELFALGWALLTLLVSGGFVLMALRAQAQVIELSIDLASRRYIYQCSTWRRDEVRRGSLDELADVQLSSEEVRDGVAPPFRQLFIHLRWQDSTRAPVGPLFRRRTGSGRLTAEDDPREFSRILAAALHVPLDDQSAKQRRSPSLKLPPVAALDSL